MYNDLKHYTTNCIWRLLTPNIVTGNVNFVHCAGDDIILDASTTSGSPQVLLTPSMEFNSRAHLHQPLPTPSLQERSQMEVPLCYCTVLVLAEQVVVILYPLPYV